MIWNKPNYPIYHKRDACDSEGKWRIEITLPQSTSGGFIWKGRSYAINSGKNNVIV
jgi:hypothetical protein